MHIRCRQICLLSLKSIWSIFLRDTKSMCSEHNVYRVLQKSCHTPYFTDLSRGERSAKISKEVTHAVTIQYNTMKHEINILKIEKDNLTLL